MKDRATQRDSGADAERQKVYQEALRERFGDVRDLERERATPPPPSSGSK